MRARFLVSVAIGLALAMTLIVAASQTSGPIAGLPVGLAPVSLSGSPASAYQSTSGNAEYATATTMSSSSSSEAVSSSTSPSTNLAAGASATTTASAVATETVTAQSTSAQPAYPPSSAGSVDAQIEASPSNLNRILSQPIDSSLLLLPIIAALLIGLVLYRTAWSRQESK